MITDDLLKITQGQLAIEDYFNELTVNGELLTKDAGSQLLFLDTNMYVMKVWYEYVFGKCEYIVLEEITKRKYDLYLLCNTDLPWVAEDMREYPDEQPRKELYNIYKDLLINQTTPWVEISGSYNERLHNAIEAVQKFCL